MAKSTIIKLIDAWDPLLRRAFTDSVKGIKSRAQLGEIEGFLKSANYEAATRAVGIDIVSFRPLDKAVADAFEAGGMFNKFGRFQFNARNPVSETWLRNHSAGLITDITDDQRTMVRSFLADGLSAGKNPRTVALDLVGRIGPNGNRVGGVIGLSNSQSKWVKDYETALRGNNPLEALSRKLRDKRFDPLLRKYAAEGKPVPITDVKNMVTSYANRALKLRAEGIARTEANAAVHEGQWQSANQAIASGAVDREDVDMTWHALFENTRDSHADMDGQTVGFGELFMSGDGNALKYPGDPSAPVEETVNCQCWVTFSYDIEDQRRAA